MEVVLNLRHPLTRIKCVVFLDFIRAKIWRSGIAPGSQCPEPREPPMGRLMLAHHFQSQDFISVHHLLNTRVPMVTLELLLLFQFRSKLGVY